MDSIKLLKEYSSQLLGIANGVGQVAEELNERYYKMSSEAKRSNKGEALWSIRFSIDLLQRDLKQKSFSLEGLTKNIIKEKFLD